MIPMMPREMPIIHVIFLGEEGVVMIDKLNELDTDKVEPLIYMSDERSVLREDEVRQTLTQKEALQNAPKKDSDYFKVPKVIDHP